MPSLLIELYDTHAIEKNVYQAFVSNCDEILFLSLKKISEEERLSLKQFIMEQVPNIKNGCILDSLTLIMFGKN